MFGATWRLYKYALEHQQHIGKITQAKFPSLRLKVLQEE